MLQLASVGCAGLCDYEVMGAAQRGGGGTASGEAETLSCFFPEITKRRRLLLCTNLFQGDFSPSNEVLKDCNRNTLHWQVYLHEKSLNFLCCFCCVSLRQDIEILSDSLK